MIGLYPFDLPANAAATYDVRRDAIGQFATGRTSGIRVAQLDYTSPKWKLAIW